MVWLVARRSVALPLPSSPHWAPSTAIAGTAGGYQRVTPPISACPRVRDVQDYLVITNSEAGTSDQENQEAAINVLSEGASVEVVSTGSPGELDGVLHRAGKRRIIVVGGDGSLHAVVKALYRRNELADSVIGLVPLGTG